MNRYNLLMMYRLISQDMEQLEPEKDEIKIHICFISVKCFHCFVMCSIFHPIKKITHMAHLVLL
jgi:hypothetical protein